VTFPVGAAGVDARPAAAYMMRCAAALANASLPAGPDLLALLGFGVFWLAAGY
jgi:hypothetical protein